MAPGLLKILDLIKATPSDQRLLSRYLSLANELSDEERSEAIIQAAKVLVTKVPQAALDLGWDLFKSGKLEQESLVVMASAMEGLGKSGKAAAIRVDAIRLTAHPVGSKENEEARRQIDTTLGSAQGKPKSQFAIDSVTRTNNNTGPEIVSPVSKLQNSPVQQLKPEMPTISADNVVTKSPEAPEIVQQPIPQFDLQESSSHPVNEKKPTAAGIPEAIPPKQPSNHSKGFLERMVRTQSAVSSGVSSLDEGMESFWPSAQDHSACHSYIKELVQGNRWEEILRFINESFDGLNDPFLITIFEAHHLTKIDIQFVGLWLDILIANCQERRALRLCLKILTEEPQLAWAKMIRSRVEIITGRLGLEAMDWREADGVMALRRKIATLRPNSQVYPVFPSIGS
ncbi:MAG: hypothetical protein WCL28_11865 [bacterium]